MFWSILHSGRRKKWQTVHGKRIKDQIWNHSTVVKCLDSWVENCKVQHFVCIVLRLHNFFSRICMISSFFKCKNRFFMNRTEALVIIPSVRRRKKPHCSG